ncbi:very short patch repair endonuclease [Hoeflea alexandrii]|uniref:very short patch repair endonuclease n=1 Tax=Hoeflea alexandrii TaxID=288436 RepID=UPI0022AF2F06|nr:very short patch repair endonuclease [Hoeflea alexandrii]MCZ4290794.1 very short patch repair endonuclease [Hoeflea alexandrii]
MTDIVDKQTRSRMMSGIRGQNTKPEMQLRRALHIRGFRYRLHEKKLPGKPDLVFPKFGAIIFVHGCFWHRHEGCRFSTIPSTRKEFWQNKFRGNVARDHRNIEELVNAGWRVAVVWECDLRFQLDAVSRSIETWLKSSEKDWNGLVPQKKP